MKRKVSSVFTVTRHRQIQKQRVRRNNRFKGYDHVGKWGKSSAQPKKRRAVIVHKVPLNSAFHVIILEKFLDYLQTMVQTNNIINVPRPLPDSLSLSRPPHADQLRILRGSGRRCIVIHDRRRSRQISSRPRSPSLLVAGSTSHIR